MNIENNIKTIKLSLSENCRLIAVSKTQPTSKILEAYEVGHRDFGENKVQELIQKFEALPKNIQWHMIGHLQSNKVKFIAPFIHMIHAVDSFKLLQEIDKQGQKVNRIINCLLQVHIADEETKFGFSSDEIIQVLSSSEMKNLTNVKINGLMGMATLTDNTEQIRNEFKGLKTLFEKIKVMTLPESVEMIELSMGMSSDYPIAVEEGSTMVRVGSSIFGERNY
jgi:pyridoxal phosphate enzyme (YggS family)